MAEFEIENLKSVNMEEAQIIGIEDLPFIRGPEGPQGPEGPIGPGITILDSYTSLEELQEAHPTGNIGDAYLVNSDLYIWSSGLNMWENSGTIRGPQGEEGSDVVVSATEPQGNERLKVWIQKGKNLLSEYNWEQGAINQSTGKVSASTTRLRTFNFIYVKPNISYAISVENDDYCFLNIIMYDENDNYINAYYNIDSSISGATSKIVEFPSDCTKVKIVLRHTDNVSVLTPSLISTIKPMLAQSSTIIEYEPYIKPKLYILNSNNEYETLLESKEIEFTDYKTGIVKKDTYVSNIIMNWCEVKDRVAYVNIKIELKATTIETGGYSLLEGLPPSKTNAEVQAHLNKSGQNESIRLRVYDTGELYWWYNPNMTINTGDVLILDISYPTI